MFNIAHAAEGGKYSIMWNYALTKEILARLSALGYKVEHLDNAEKNKYYKFLIRWDK